jgi:hypothetical protein
MAYDMLIDRYTNTLDKFSVTMVRRNNMHNGLKQLLAWLLVVLVSLPWPGRLGAQGTGTVFKSEEIEQLVAPIALYPDDLVSQILMASTYPLEVVEAARWLRANKTLKGDALTTALEQQTWDPSVKSLVNFPQVLDMMDQKLDLTQRLGDAFLAQQKDVLDAIQRLRAKAQAQGNLKTTKEQRVIVEQPPAQTTIVEQPPAQTTVIRIEPANPQVVYVPTYNPTVVYGAWPYPAYPPYTYYPPGYAVATAAFSFTAGVALGAAWGYAWGGCNWRGGDVDININRNTNFNTNINRQRYQSNFQARGLSAQGAWQHDASHRRGVAYRDQGTAQRFNRGTNAQAAASREAFRGRAEKGRQELARGGAGRSGQAGARDRGGAGSHASSIGDRGGRGKQGERSGRAEKGRQELARGGAGRSGQAGARDHGGAGSHASGLGDRGGRGERGARSGHAGGLGDRSAQRGDFGSASRGRQAEAFQGLGRGGEVRNASARGASSWSGARQASGGGNFQRASGGGGSHGGGGFHGGGGGGRGGGGRRR